MSNGFKQRGMNDERNEESGKFASKYADEDFLAALEELGGIGGTGDVASEVDCPQRTAYNRLKQLHERGVVASREAGPSIVWMLPLVIA